MTGRILLVDDDRHLLQVLANWLNSEGFHVTPAFDGEEALMAVERHSPDVVIADVSMPKVDGITLAGELKHRGVPVMLVSASPLPEGTDPGIPFLRKPFDLSIFTDMVTSLLTNAPGDPG